MAQKELIMLFLLFSSCSINMESTLNKVYYYYPKYTDSLDPGYNNTFENKNLKSLLEFPIIQNEILDLKNELEIMFGTDKVEDMTMFWMENPCYHFRISTMEDGKFKLVVVFISLIDKFYYLYTPKGFKNKGPLAHKPIEKIIKKNLKNYKVFPQQWIDYIVPEIGHGNFSYGECTLFYLLFTDHIY